MTDNNRDFSDVDDHTVMEHDKMTMAAMMSSVDDAGQQLLVAHGREYQVRQIDTGRGTGQILDCKVKTDSETGLPRVEMIFSINPVVSQQGDGLQLMPAGLQVLTDSLDNDSSDFASPSELRTTNPPDTYYRSAAAAAAAAGTENIRSRSPPRIVVQTVQEIHESPPPTFPPAAQSEIVDEELAVAWSNTADIWTSDDDDELDAWKRSLQGPGDLRRRLLWHVARVLDWTNGERDPLIIVVVVTVSFLLLRNLNLSVLTTVGLVGFCLHLVEFVRLQPGVEDLVDKFTRISDGGDEVQLLESTLVRLLAAKRRLMQVKVEMAALRNDRPAAFMLVAVSGFFLLASLGQFVNSFALLYITVLLAALMPGLSKHDVINKIGLRRQLMSN